MRRTWFFKHANQYGVDPKRIVVTGGSAGGHLALMVGMTPTSAHLGPVSPVAAVIDGYGITDVVELLKGPHFQEWARQWLPAGPSQVELARRLSPLTYVRHDLPPILIAQWADDHTVPVEQSMRLHNALDLDGVPNELIIVPNAKHGFSRAQWGPLDEKIFAFLKAHGLPKPGPMPGRASKAPSSKSWLKNLFSSCRAFGMWGWGLEPYTSSCASLVASARFSTNS